MANPLNNLTLVGRVSQPIKEFPNSDGSKVLLTTIAVDDNFVSGPDRKAKTQFVPVRIFLAKTINGRGSWDRVGKGDQIAVTGRISAESYQDKTSGETVYPAPTIEIDGFPQFLEARSVTEARAAKNAVAETPAATTEVEGVDEIAAMRARLAELEAAQTGEIDADSTTPFAAAV